MIPFTMFWETLYLSIKYLTSINRPTNSARILSISNTSKQS